MHTSDGLTYSCTHCDQPLGRKRWTRKVHTEQPRLFCSTRCASQARMSRISLVCQSCGAEFHRKRSDVHRPRRSGYAILCSRACLRRHQASRVWLRCARCHVTFSRETSGFRKNKSGIYFCSKPCYDASREQTPDGRRARAREIYHTRSKHSVQYRIIANLRKRTRRATQGKKRVGSAIRDLGCSTEELRMHLATLFTAGMTWENYGSGVNKWNLDHRIPLSSFDLENRDEFLRAAHYSNLQPMWAIENFRKGDRMPDE